MKITYQSLALYIVGVSMACCFSACEDDMVDSEVKLTGDISKYVPSYSVLANVDAVNVYDGYQYVRFAPKINADLDKWGLKISQAKYYIDDVLVSTIDRAPFVFNYRSKDLYEGNHQTMSSFVISGDGCDNVVLRDTANIVTTECREFESTSDIYLEYNNVFEDDILKMVPHVNEEKSEKGCKIKKVRYYWDNELKLETIKEPYEWNFNISDKAGTSHNIIVDVEYSSEAYPNVNTSSTFSIFGYNILTDDSSFPRFNFKSSSSAYKNGETLKGVIYLYKGRKCEDSYDVMVYFDDKEIIKTSTFPYDVSYPLKGESIGIHDVKVRWHVEKGDGSKYSYTTIYKIVVNG